MQPRCPVFPAAINSRASFSVNTLPTIAFASMSEFYITSFCMVTVTITTGLAVRLYETQKPELS